MNDQPKYYNEATKNAIMKYQKDKMERVAIWVPKGMGTEWKNHAELVGESQTAFIKRAVAETMARDRQRIREALKNAPKEESEE